MTLVGYGFGSLSFGIASDLLHPIVGDESVRYVLMGAAELYRLPCHRLGRLRGVRATYSVRNPGRFDQAPSALLA